MESLILDFNNISISLDHNLMLNNLVSNFNQLSITGNVKEEKKYIQMIFFSLEPCFGESINENGFYQTHYDKDMVLVQANLYILKDGTYPLIETKSFNEDYVKNRVLIYLNTNKNCKQLPKKIIPIFTNDNQMVVLVWMPSFNNNQFIKNNSNKHKNESKLRKSQSFIFICNINRSISPHPQNWFNQISYDNFNFNTFINVNNMNLIEIINFILEYIIPQNYPELNDYVVDIPYIFETFKTRKFNLESFNYLLC